MFLDVMGQSKTSTYDPTNTYLLLSGHWGGAPRGAGQICRGTMGCQPSLPGTCGGIRRGAHTLHKKKEGCPHGHPYIQINMIIKIPRFAGDILTSLSLWGYIRRLRRRHPVWGSASGQGSVWDPAWASDRAAAWALSAPWAV